MSPMETNPVAVHFLGPVGFGPIEPMHELIWQKNKKAPDTGTDKSVPFDANGSGI